ncbi:PLP-dependent aminotransferase family protein [Gallibacterium salpingitidis]|uniref:GntR family transcriptional regulator n=1 Tax=Gallibacterium salpingitidis TaxID=505341 RepID=A0A1A7NRW3_9PAST|nr:PLP-dependent aminotransferase family protein [Gallibacterium salpingitidis]OBW91744.1 GntR family transcriptional regulator [Gallibacterium salpingitidis]
MKHFAYQLNKSLSQPLYLQLYQQIKQAIHQGILQQGEALPAKRRLADYLAISQNTVENSYAQLLAEGYIESKPRIGYFVSTELLPTMMPLVTSVNEISQTIPEQKWQYDFNPNVIDGQHFPFELWKKLQKQFLNRQHTNLLALGDKQGEYELRRQIADYLYSARGVKCRPEQVVINAGVELCLLQLMLLWQHRYPAQQAHYAMEEFGYPVVEKLWQSYAGQVLKLPIDNQTHKVDLSILSQHHIDLLYITPSHQYPFGSVLTIGERQQLLAWANTKEQRYLIEDDYDSEFRYQGKPIPALKSLDQHNKVVYLGSFSKLIMPSVRISYMVLPEPLLAIYQQKINFFNSSVSRLDQQVVALFMQSGAFEKHINRMRKYYRRKMELLCQQLKLYSPSIRFWGESSGFYLLIEVVDTPYTLQQLLAFAEQQAIKVYPIELHQRKLFVLGFGNLSEQALLTGVKLLLEGWQIKKPTR